MRKPTSVFYTASARKDLRKLNPAVSRKIVLTVQRYTLLEPLSKAKQLTGLLHGMYRYRIGDYRALFEYSDTGVLTIVTILRIKHRKDVYN